MTGKCRRGPEKKGKKEDIEESYVIEERPTIREPLKDFDCIERSKMPLKKIQIDTVKYFSGTDSLLVVHGTGSGKTLTALAASQCYLNQYPENRIIVIAPASVQTNFHKEMKKYGGTITDNYSFYTYDRIMLLRKNKTPIDAKNSLVILDEVQNIKNYNGRKFSAVMKCVKKCDKVLLLTATPAINHIIDFISIINLLYKSYIIGPTIKFPINLGYIPDIYKNELRWKYKLRISFSRDEKVRENNNKKQLNGIIKKLLEGRVSYTEKPVSSEFPSFTIHEKFIKMKKSYEQKYFNLVLKEDFYNKFGSMNESLKLLNIKSHDYTIDNVKDNYKNLKLKNQDNPLILKELLEAYETVTYNLLYSKEDDEFEDEFEDEKYLFKKPSKFYHGYRRAVNKLGDEYFSQKINKIIKKLNSQSIIFSNWIEFGIDIIKKILKNNNIKYGVISGDISQETRDKNVKKYNNKEIQVLIITRAGSEGIDLKNTKNVFILDPVWNPSGIEQIIGRAIRRNSHIDLPIEEQHVDIWVLILVENSFDSSIDEISKSGDFLLYKIIKKKEYIMREVENMLKSISINTQE